MSHTPRKRFGQNFLRDPHVLEKILNAISPQADDHIVEIGPGEGVLTRLLLPLVKQLDVVEIDRDLVALLQERFVNFDQLTIHQADALQFDMAPLHIAEPLRIVGNLPYNISTPLLFHLFDQLDHIKDMYFLLQKEVVERLCAPVGDKHYSRLSVMAQYFCHTQSLFTVGPAAFYPKPKVDSAFIRLTPITTRDLTATDLTAFGQLVKQAFMYRRKTIANSLKSLVAPETLTTLDIDPGLRPQQLSVNDFVRISNAILVR